jgi:hypothetical protein
MENTLLASDQAAATSAGRDANTYATVNTNHLAAALKN